MSEEREPTASERAASYSSEAKPSDLDAMGNDKRRKVIGKQYGATVQKQLTVYGIFLLVLGIIVFGSLTIVSDIDNRDIPLENTAPWTEVSSDEPVRDIDFPNNGCANTIPADEIATDVIGEPDLVTTPTPSDCAGDEAP